MKNDTETVFFEKNANGLREVATARGHLLVEQRNDKPDLSKPKAQKNRP